ncbi:substrate-binding domain-containing protein [Spirillospora sp. NPDC047279]|uniref:substrate-binding domain-containing protein n=1 Tax=Spirillospora sp. NPDC047279 TaxID=3155478 RepID=UPI00340A92B7
MSGRHRNDFPEGTPGDGGFDPSRPVFGPANDGSSDWFAGRDGRPGTPGGGSGPYPQPGGASGPYPQQGGGLSGPHAQQGGGVSGPHARPGGTGRHPAMPGDTGAQRPPSASGSSETPEWFTPRQSSEHGVYGGGTGAAGAVGGASASGGYGGGSDTGGYGVGRPPSGPPGPGGPGGQGRPGGERGPAAASGMGGASGSYGDYDSISRSDERPTGFFGGRAGGSGDSGGYGGPGGPGGSGGSGGYGGGSGEYGRRRKKRSATALIGPMAGAVGLALLLGVGVYAFAGSGGSCGEGDDSLRLDVAAAPDVAPAVLKAAERFNGARHKVGGKCVTAKVAKTESAAAATLLSGQGVTGGGNQRPDVWIPDSSLWTSIVRSSSKGKETITPTKTSVASSPLVVGLPRSLALQLKQQGVTATPSWDNLLKAAGGVPGGAVTKNQMIPANAIKLLVPDPSRNSAGMAGLMVTSILLTNDPNQSEIFTGIVRTVRESTVPTVNAQYTQFRKGRTSKQPVALSSEQALFAFNKRNPAEPAQALYPVEGTLSMDYPFTVTSGDGDKQKAARLLEQAMSTENTRNDVRALGFRTPDGKAPSGFTEAMGVSPARPRQLPSPRDADVQKVMQSWSRLSLGLRMLTLIDVSGSMAEMVGPNTNRLQAIAQISQGGLSMMSDDTELGQWLFSTRMRGKQAYQESVSIGPLGERVGSGTRRGMVLSTLSQMKPKPNGDTGLYQTLIAAYREMSKTFKPEFGNSILLLTDGKNDDVDGPTLAQTLKTLRDMKDPNKPIQVNMIGFGKGVDRNELDQIAKATNGSVQVAQTPQEISKIFLRMLSRRITQ